MEGSGFTVIVKVCSGPLQVILSIMMVGVTVIVATAGGDVLVAVKDGMLPCPLETKPILGSLFTQLNTVPGSVD